MPTAWRITTTADPDQAFSGDGARTRGGRWNSKGTRVVYAADYPAAAILEQLVQTSSVASLPLYNLFRVSLPGTMVSVVESNTLPSTWRDPERDPAVQAIGDTWVATRTSLALQVPSAVAPHHVNYLLNPAHPDFPTLTIAAPEPFALDSRRPRQIFRCVYKQSLPAPKWVRSGISGPGRRLFPIAPSEVSPAGASPHAP